MCLVSFTFGPSTDEPHKLTSIVRSLPFLAANDW